MGFQNFRVLTITTSEIRLANFRVLTITTSEMRLANMLEVVSEVADGIAQGLFLFTTAQRFATHGPFAS